MHMMLGSNILVDFMLSWKFHIKFFSLSINFLLDLKYVKELSGCKTETVMKNYFSPNAKFFSFLGNYFIDSLTGNI